MVDAKGWGAAGTKYEIHEETFSGWRKLLAIGIKGFEHLTPNDLRALVLRKSEVLGGHVDFEGSETEIIIPCEGNEDGVPVSVYKPTKLNPVPTILIYCHGGGLVAGSRNICTTMLKTLTKRAECIAVNVEYRLAPENKVPAALEDCRAVVRWVLANKTVIGGKEDSAVGFGGDSAGGYLTACMSHDVPGLAFQILVYPGTDFTLSSPTCTEFAEAPYLSMKALQWFVEQYLRTDSVKTDPAISPYYKTFSSRLPPALCILAELDPMRGDGLAYCKKLKEAGVPTDVLVVKGAPHGFFHVPGHFKELTKEAYDKCVDLLRRFQK